MQRARNPLPIEMWGLNFDPITGRYFLNENGLTYFMTLEHTRLLKAYYRGNGSDHPTIEKWYNDLDRFTRNEIFIKGKTELSDFYFHPDPQYELYQ